MNVNDLIVQGGEPLFFLDYLALHTLDPAVTTQMVKGISDGCMEAGCALLGGETAEMPAVYAPGEFDMAGFAVGVVERSKILNPDIIEAGDSIIGLASSGLHSNGYALARRVVEKSGAGLAEFIPELQCTLGEELLRPTAHLCQNRAETPRQIQGQKNRQGHGPHHRRRPAGQSARASCPRLLRPPQARRLDPPADLHLARKITAPWISTKCTTSSTWASAMCLIVRPTFTKPIMSALRTLGEKPCFLGKIRKATGEPVIEWG